MISSLACVVKACIGCPSLYGNIAAQAAGVESTEPQVIKLPEAKVGLALLRYRRAAELRFGRLNRFRRLARDYESFA